MIDLLDLGFSNLAKGVRVAAGGEKDNFQTVSQLTFDQARRNVSPGQLSIALADLKTPAKPIAKAPQSAKSKPQPASTKPKKSVELANWSVQIGSFNSKKQATTALRSAIKSLGPLGRAAKQSVQSAKVGGKVTYRARLVGLSQEKAQLACVKLEKSGRTCMPINAS